jgi:DNA uptake protein ComE-like DNA-binding protein
MFTLRRKLLAVALLIVAIPGFSAPTHISAQANKPSSSSSAAPLDINTATPDQLKALPGIGDAYTKRIIDGRPYTAKNQLLSRGILPAATYDKIKDQIIASRPKK